jgi:hypothetical protein
MSISEFTALPISRAVEAAQSHPPERARGKDRGPHAVGEIQ